MKKVIFEKIVIQGFGSMRDEHVFNLNEGGLTMVKGLNGAGKTTLFSALSWAVHKVPLKDIEAADVATWAEFRGNDYRGTRVMLYYSVDGLRYMIARHINFKDKTEGYKGDSTLMLFEETSHDKFEMIGEAHHKNNQKEWIERNIGVDSKTFLNSIIFGQRMKRLIESDNKDKRALFESLFEVDFVAAAKTKGETKITEKMADIKIMEGKITAKEDSVKLLEERIAEQQATLDRFDADKAERVETLRVELKETMQELDVLRRREKELQPLADKYDKELLGKLDVAFDAAKKAYDNAKEATDNIRKKAKKYLREQNDVQDKIDKLKEDKKNVKTICPSCEGPLKKENVEKVKKALDAQIKIEEEVAEQLAMVADTVDKSVLTCGEAEDKAKKDFEAAKENLTKTEESFSDFEKAFDDLKLVKNSIAHKKEAVEKVEGKIDTELAKEPPVIDLTKLRAEQEEGIQTAKDLRKRIAEESAEVERLAWWVKKGFGAGGLKAFVFNAMLAKLNISVQKYAARLGVGVSFTIDLTKETKPFVTKCYMEDREVNYGALSGGQKQRIDLCIAFAMHDIVTEHTDFNVLVLDEAFEGLDELGRSVAFDFVRMKVAAGKTVYVITHNTLLDNRNSKSMTIKLNNGVTEIVD